MSRPKQKQNESLNVQIIRRAELQKLSSILSEGKIHTLGALLEFRKNPYLAQFMPEEARLSLSWVHLDPEQVLDTHQHPTSSMIIVCEGEGETRGEVQSPISAGDIVAVPPNRLHGFIGKGKTGFWALSIQFEGLGLYENREKPRVKFAEEGKETPPRSKGFDLLLSEQKRLEKEFESHELLKLAQSKKLDPKVKERLLEALNYWSDWFQKIISMRVATSDKDNYFVIAEQHLEEEVGHNTILYKMRLNKPVSFWDPVLDASASWFYAQMMSGTDEEKVILIHFVLEGASNVFHPYAQQHYNYGDHFDVHSVLDIEHFEMGLRLIEKERNIDYEALISLLHKGWKVFSLIATQIARYAVSDTRL